MAESVTGALSVSGKLCLWSVELISTLQQLAPCWPFCLEQPLDSETWQSEGIFSYHFITVNLHITSVQRNGSTVNLASGPEVLCSARICQDRHSALFPDDQIYRNCSRVRMFAGDRPYWWVGETHLYNAETRPHLRQFPNTCEAGPGTPSGHLMMNVALFYVILKGVSSEFIWKRKSLSKWQKSVVAASLYSMYFLWIGVIFVSRLYIQAHFIHQNVLGIVMGLLVGHFAWSNHWIVRPGRVKAVLTASFLIISSLSIYTLLLSKGMDPLWTLPLALKYCARPEYVRIDTQPFFLMTRFTGTALGLGLGLSSDKRLAAVNAPRSIVRTILTMKAGVILGKVASLIQASFPADDLLLFLALSFSLSIALPFAVISLLPHLLVTVYYGN